METYKALAQNRANKPSHSSGSYSSYTTSFSKATPTATPGLADEVIHSFLATNADDVDLIHEDLDQIDDLDLEEMDINWQIAMTAIKIKKFYKKTGRRPRVDGKMHVAFDKRKVECFNCHNTGHFARECKFKGSKEGNKQEAGYYDIPLYSRFKQVEYKGVPHPLSGDYTPRAQEDIDDSLYVYGKHGPQPQSPSPTVSNASSIVFSICPSNDSDGELGAVSDASSTHYSTCQSNDSDGELGTVTDHSVNDDLIHDQAPLNYIGKLPLVINWNQRMNRDLGAGYSFERKPCYVCGSLSHLIKDCDYYEKKMAREAALKSKRVVHADVRQATPAWTNTNRVNKANQFTPRPVQLSNIRPNLSTASKTIKTGSNHVNSGSVHVNSGTQFKSGAADLYGKLHVNSGSDHPLVAYWSIEVFSDSGCSGHMTGNRAHLRLSRTGPKWDMFSFGGSKVLLKSSRQHNMYTFDMKNVVSSKAYTCLLAKASSDEAKLWHRRLGHLNFKNLNKLVKDNLVRGLPSKSLKKYGPHLCCLSEGKAHRPLAVNSAGYTFNRPIGKVDGKSDEGFLVGSSMNNSMKLYTCLFAKSSNPTGSKEVIDIDEQTDEAAELMVISSTSRKAAVSENIATKKTHSPKQPSSTPISSLLKTLLPFEKSWMLCLKHLGPVLATKPTITPGNIEAISPSADHEEEVFSDADDDEMLE
ncbi:ribonuclease H-like domain-containing protein [Tanacetum coccineum]